MRPNTPTRRQRVSHAKPTVESLETRDLLSIFPPITFPLVTANPPDGSGAALAVGDFNRDGRSDLAVNSAAITMGITAGVSALLNSGSDSFVQAPSSAYASIEDSTLLVTDLRGNGIQDIINGSDVFLGNGDGTFSKGTPLPVIPLQLATGNTIVSGKFTNDGHTDLAVLQNGAITILLGNGDGTFRTGQTLLFADGDDALAAGDFLGNGKIDLVVSSPPTLSNNMPPFEIPGSGEVFLGNGDGTFQSGIAGAGGAIALITADLTGNGRSDIVGIFGNGFGGPGSLAVLLSNGDGTFSAMPTLNPTEGFGEVAVTDINGDGIPDLVALGTTGGVSGLILSTFTGDGHGNFTAGKSFNIGNLNLPLTGNLLGVGSFIPGDTSDIVVGPVGNSALVFPVNQTTSLNQACVSQLYLDLLHRAADPTGLNGFTNLLNSGASRTQVALDIEDSLEYRTNEVDGLYEHVLNRAPDSAGLQGWVNFLVDGGTYNAAEAAFIASPEYASHFPDGPQNQSDFVTAVYQTVLNRAPDSAGMQGWLNALNQGTSRSAVALAIISSQEADQQLIETMYLAYLRRNPDPTGLAGFVNMLLSGSTREQVAAIILGSAEYFANL
jgi:hypothetical protein